jgi:hypothetical protein
MRVGCNLFIAAINAYTTKLINMKTTYTKLFRLIAKILDRILFAFKMFPTKNPTTPNWLYSHRIASTAYPDGTRYEYVGSININDLKRKKVTAK